MHFILSDLKSARSVLVLLGVFVALGSVYAVTTPLFEASDELWHYPMAQHLSRGGALPVQNPKDVGPWRQEASQPPLYYYLMGWAISWIDTSDMPQVRWLNPHVDNGVVTPDGNINLAVHTSAENFPWRGTALAVRLVRLLSVLMSAGTVLFTFLLAREFFSGRWEPLAAAAFVAFLPMFVFISGAVNNDNLASLLSAAILFLLVYFVRRRGWGWFERFGSRAGLIASATLGLLLGLAALTKQSALGSLALAGLALAAVGFQQANMPENAHADRRPPSAIRYFSFVIRHSVVVFGLAALIAGWWYYRNFVLYGDLLGWNAFVAVLGRRAAPASLAQLWGERAGFMQSFWGLFGGVNVPMPNWTYLILNATAFAAIIGCAIFYAAGLWRFARRREWSLDSLWAGLPHLLVLGQVAIIFYGLIQWATVTWSSQGRLIFSGISAVAVLFIVGLRTILPARIGVVGLTGAAAFMAALTALAPFLWIAPKYVDPPSLTPEQIAAIPRRAEVDFGAINFPAEMRLLGFSISADSVAPGGSLEVTLYWQSLAPMDRDWSVFVHVVDENNIVVAQRDTFPGLGLMPTRKWKAGQTLADTYVIPLPATTYAPSKARLEIGLYDYDGGERLLIATEGHPQAGSDSLTLAPLNITANPGDLPNPQTINFDYQIELAGYQMDRRALRAGDSLTLTLYWRGLRPMTANYSVFAHVRGAGESLWAQSDSWPQDGRAPTAAWQPEQVVIDSRALTIKADTAPGVYDVEVGLYDSSGDRLQIVLPDGRRTDNFVYLAKIRVLP